MFLQRYELLRKRNGGISLFNIVLTFLLPPDMQQKLSEQVSKSFALRRDAHALLGEAKAMVERAIESTA